MMRASTVRVVRATLSVPLLVGLAACSSSGSGQAASSSGAQRSSAVGGSTGTPSASGAAPACSLLTERGAASVLKAAGPGPVRLRDSTATRCAYKQGPASVTLVVGAEPAGVSPQTLANEAAAAQHGAIAMPLDFGGSTGYGVALDPSRELIYASLAGKVFFLDGEFFGQHSDYTAAHGSPALAALAAQIAHGQ